MKIRKTAENTFFALGTLCKITVVFEADLFGIGVLNNEEHIKEVLKEASEMVQDLDNKLSVFKSTSEISEMAKNAGSKATIVSERTFDILEKALWFCDISRGALDISVRPLLDLWGFGHKMESNYSVRQQIPTKDEINQKLDSVGYKKVIIDKTMKTVNLENKGMALDFGALAKGYATDLLSAFFVSKGINNALIDLGGNVFALGKKRKDKYWDIGVQLPWGERGEFFGHINLFNESLVTSGAYERSIVIDGRSYNHTINPLTGYPLESDIISVSVLCKESFVADAVATMVYVLGVDETIEIMKENYKDDYLKMGLIVLEKNKKIKITKSLKSRFFVTKKDLEIVYL